MTLRLDLPPWIVFPYLFILGAIVGSFLNVCIYRIPSRDRLRDQLRSLWERPSQCPRCRTKIRWSDNVPIFGWLKLRGRCRVCRMRISPRYPLIELLNACLWMLVFWMEVPLGSHASLEASCVYSTLGPQAYPGLGWLSVEWFVVLRFLYHMLLIEALLVATFIDFDLRIIPDGSTLPAMAAGVLLSLAIARVHLVPVWFQTPNQLQTYGILFPDWLHPLLSGPAVPGWITAWPHLHGLAVSLAGLLVGGGLVWLVRLIGYWFLRQEAMGFGDVILMALIGSFLGWQATVIAFFIAPAAAMTVVAATYLWNLLNRLRGRAASMDRMIPYGPYLSLGALLAILFWQPLFERSRHVFEMGVLLAPVAGLMAGMFAVALLLVQGLKWTLGIRDVPEPESCWRSADQLAFYAGKTADEGAHPQKRPQWDGVLSARGSLHNLRWRGKRP